MPLILNNIPWTNQLTLQMIINYVLRDLINIVAFIDDTLVAKDLEKEYDKIVEVVCYSHKL